MTVTQINAATDAEIELVGIPQDAADRVKELLVLGGGTLTRDDILRDAEDEDSPLHRYFTWDDAEAARKYREEQAEALVRRIKIRVTRKDQPPVAVRALIARREVDPEGEAHEYVPMSNIAGRPEYEARLQQSIERDMRALQNKYSSTTDLLRSVAAEVFDL